MKIYCTKEQEPVLEQVSHDYLEDLAGTRSWLFIGYLLSDDDADNADAMRRGYWIKVLDVSDDRCHCLCVSDRFLRRSDVSTTNAIENATETNLLISQMCKWSNQELMSTKDLYDYYTEVVVHHNPKD